MHMDKSVNAPIGHQQFCADYRPACDQVTDVPKIVPLSQKRWDELIAINRHVNQRIEPTTDAELWGRPEFWAYASLGAGDCEEYVLEKQRALVAAGWPLSALLITVVKDLDNSGHAVLTVRTSLGDLILDNKAQAVLPWYATPYRYIKRQSATVPSAWTGIADTRITTVGSLGKTSGTR
ncbi:transglutaminase [Roseibium sp. RKSG952]|nr:transglutaminase [Roseibium sp. RKSG952]